MNCQYCHKVCQKAGRQKSGKQKYYCTRCRKYQQASYRYSACSESQRRLFMRCLLVGNSLSGIRSITGIAISTQIRWIRKLGNQCIYSSTFKHNDVYELDELCTYIGSKAKRRWVVSAISRNTGQVVEVKTGTRTKNNLESVVSKLLSLSPKAIYTDKLPAYKSLIPRELHKTKRGGINKIERFHITLRTHIKRLNRRTICYSKQQDMLDSLLKIYIRSFNATNIGSISNPNLVSAKGRQV